MNQQQSEPTITTEQIEAFGKLAEALTPILENFLTNEVEALFDVLTEFIKSCREWVLQNLFTSWDCGDVIEQLPAGDMVPLTLRWIVEAFTSLHEDYQFGILDQIGAIQWDDMSLTTFSEWIDHEYLQPSSPNPYTPQMTVVKHFVEWMLNIPEDVRMEAMGLDLP